MEAKGYFLEGNQVFLLVPKCLLVFSKAEWIKAIGRGKGVKRAQQMMERARKNG